MRDRTGRRRDVHVTRLQAVHRDAADDGAAAPLFTVPHRQVGDAAADAHQVALAFHPVGVRVEILHRVQGLAKDDQRQREVAPPAGGLRVGLRQAEQDPPRRIHARVHGEDRLVEPVVVEVVGAEQVDDGR